MTKKITFGDLHRLLIENGFEQTSVNGPYVVFEHDASGALQAFRAHRATELVDPMTLASVRKTLLGFGFMDEDEFEQTVQEAAAQRKVKAKQR
jgi:hypothetical protein